MSYGELSNTQETMVMPLLQMKNIRGKPYITVSAKGMINGLSNIPNDGADFGPDTTSGATAPGQYGGTYTETSGIQEAWNDAVAVGIYSSALGKYFIPAIILETGTYHVKKTITLSGSGKAIDNVSIYGVSSMSPYIYAEFNSGYLFDLDASSFYDTNIEFSRMQPYVPSGYTPAGIINADFSSTNPRANEFISYEFNISNTGWTGAPLNLISFANIMFYDLNDYSDSVSVYSANETIQFFGGVIFGINAQSASVAGNAVVLTIIGARYTQIELGAGFDLYIIGGRATHYINSCQITLNGDVNTVHIDSKLWGIASPFITGSYSIQKLFVRGTYGNGYISSATVLVDSTVTVEDADVKLVNVSPYSVSMPVNTPTLSTNPPVSGTAYQNTNPYDIYVSVPITFPTTASTAMSAYLRVGTSSTAGANPIMDQFAEPATLVTVNGRIWSLKAKVPAGQYFEVDTVNASIGTAVVAAA